MLNTFNLKHGSYVESIKRIWNLTLCPQGDRGWIMQWEDVIGNTTTF
jgi:hypothetical protein